MGKNNSMRPSNGVWLILDSLSYNSTPFASDGPDSMPRFQTLAEDEGVIFSEAYAPGPFSPSSHASFFTGELPSTTGMYEAYPFFNSDIPTIADFLSETHRTSLISVNHFLFQGLERGFDYVNDIGRTYMHFQNASDPKDYSKKYNSDPRLKRFVDFLRDDGKPFKSVVNGLKYRFGEKNIKPKEWGDERDFQYADTMGEMILDQLSSHKDDSFVVANFMDLHGPFDVSDEALNKFFSDTDRSEIPLGVVPRRDKLRGEKSYDPAKMYNLYKAAIWDLDRKFTSLVKDLIDNDIFVAVCADHGWYDTNSAYSDERLHIPVVLFSPEEENRRISHTVSLRQLPRTTAEVLLGDGGEFNGPSLLKTESDQVAVSEVVHKPNEIYEKTKRVYVNRPSQGAEPNEIQRDLVLFKGDAKVQFVDGSCDVIRGDSTIADELIEQGQNILDSPINYPDGDQIMYDERTEDRLKHLGYLS
ncbi:sulfatase-like hydrolase/transferase [Halobellus litoreus]|uniref:Sulfatase-like hydrolase/transferase n=1 Tax=Halobellus litoreus TaxID=755310 RepID=A0ABD6DX62_9EURY|nr:sulfatase-like hydrolase/transferase [Halobellus litoreus]